MESAIRTDVKCYHCGEPCEETLWLQDKSFCCFGCKTVFEILSENNLCEYYDLEKNPGVQLRHVNEESYAFLDKPDIRKKVVSFDSPTFTRVQFFVPAIHCVSCIWLLENLGKVNSGIIHSEVNFARKNVTLDFNPDQVSVSATARLLASLGYAPVINLNQDAKSKSVQPTDKSLIIKLTVAGFCFGNVMLFSFPEYLGLEQSDQLTQVFSWLNILLSIPVLLYSDVDYMISSWRSFKQRQINIDVPIAVGLVALFTRSVFDILSGSGPGYLDSFTGLVFFLLVGRWFQGKTYENLAFDRDFKSYFPLAALRSENDDWVPTLVHALKKGDRVKIRNMEIIPADCLLLDDEAFIDYSFVTGESRPVHAKQGDRIYAGGKLIGQPVTLLVQKEISQSHLTSLWNKDIFQKPDVGRSQRLIDTVARYFVWAILALSALTAAYWYITDASQMWLVVTSVLIVACPCALALTTPFTYGNMVRVFGRQKFYLKNAEVIERMASIDAVVFDKTGTVTHGSKPTIYKEGKFSQEVLRMVGTLTGFSTHPLSKLIHAHLKVNSDCSVSDFKEISGKGIIGTVDGQQIKIGSAVFVDIPEAEERNSTRVYISVNNQVLGFFSVKTTLRNNIKGMLTLLGARCVALLSGDNQSEEQSMKKLFPASTQLLFNQSPHDKLDYISNLQHQGKRVMMLGDGLNDSGALKQSDVGIAVTDDTGIFTPACDGILQGDQVTELNKFLRLSKSATSIVKAGFVLSFLYNAVALSFAVSGYLTPLIAAILMPLSSISVVVFTTVAVNWAGYKTFRIINQTAKSRA